MSRKARIVDTPPFPSSESGPQALRDAPQQLSIAAQRTQAIENAIAGALDKVDATLLQEPAAKLLGLAGGFASVGNHVLLPAAIAYPSSANFGPTNGGIAVTPWVCPNDLTFDQVGIEVATSGTGNVRVVIYEDNGMIYPGDLLYSSGNLSLASATTVTEAVADQPLMRGSLYWVGILAVITGGTPLLSGVDLEATVPMLGVTNVGDLVGAVYYLKTGQSFPAPDPFPASATATSNDPPAIWLQRSA